MQDFSSFDLIIDARSPREYEEDHIPGAVNMPVVNNDEYAEVGTLHRTDKMAAYSIGVRYSLANIARHLSEDLPRYPKDGKVLVYCFRGGKRSKLWFDALETIGYDVQKLNGGWKAYRRWVNDQLETAPAAFKYHVLSGPTGCGKTRLLQALKTAGCQVIDLEGLARHRGSIIGGLPGVAQPSQKYFDTLLLQELGKCDPRRPVWVEAESKKIGNVQLPTSLMQAMRQGTTIRVHADMKQRVNLWREDYRHFEENPQGLLDRLHYIRSLVGGKEFEEWESLAQQGKMPELFERLMTNHYDPAYRRSILREFPAIDESPLIELHDLSQQGLLQVAHTIREEHDRLTA
ncbi:MAG TPA: tRNA 2-selenouridine(34) synthase MnmH [Limnobacter sp.]|nr:tRNA 2-selenouridine(34) synthase MnmH [Limnobacter sp.]